MCGRVPAPRGAQGPLSSNTHPRLRLHMSAAGDVDGHLVPRGVARAGAERVPLWRCAVVMA